MKLKHAVAGTIRKMRIEQNIKLRDFDSYISYGHLSEIEKGKKTPSIDMLNEIAKGLHVTMPELLRNVAEYMEEN